MNDMYVIAYYIVLRPRGQEKRLTEISLFWLLVYKASQPRSCSFLGYHCKATCISGFRYWCWNFEILECICVCIYVFCILRDPTCWVVILSHPVETMAGPL